MLKECCVAAHTHMGFALWPSAGLEYTGYESLAFQK